MPAKKKSTPKRAAPKKSGSRSHSVQNEQDIVRNKEIVGIIVIAAAVLLLLNFILAPDVNEPEINAFGVVSLFFIKCLRFLAGSGAISLPIFLGIFGVLICAGRNQRNNKGRLFGLSIMFVAILGFLHLSHELLPFKEYINVATSGVGGGLLGALLDFALLKTIGHIGAVVVLVALLIIGLLLAFQTSLKQVFAAIGKGFMRLKAVLNFDNSEQNRPQTIEMSEPKTRKKPLIITPDDPPLITEPEPMSSYIPPPETPFVRDFMPSITGLDPTTLSDNDEGENEQIKSDIKAGVAGARSAAPSGNSIEDKPEDASDDMFAPLEHSTKEYRLPPIDLIESGIKVRNPRLNKLITDKIGVLETTLANFGVKATVTQVVAGPAVTRYELQPAPGVKVARITSLSDDIALSLAAQSVRIEAPIPGKSAIGIEVARQEVDVVYFREMIENENFQKAESKLSVALGKNIGGECVVADLTKMPHLLIAGTTGSGKSICVNTIICSILYKATPDEVKLMLIDPKKVELTAYVNLPHLIAPVITDSKKASNALKWVVNEMETRYTLFAGAGVKDIAGYNLIKLDDPLPKVVVIIDELADLMMVARHDVEDSICRIAQLARAAGIHLVVATQRPSVDVITGLIKANIPSRIAFTVSSPVDSRTILDTGGAEKLLGKGDMLFDPVGNSKPIRIQGTFIGERDVARLTEYCAEQAMPAFSEHAVAAAVSGVTNGSPLDDLDDLFYEAGMLIINTGQASTSFLQRRLSIGNPRAARIMDMLESEGVVGGPNGSKPREVLLDIGDFEEKYG